MVDARTALSHKHSRNGYIYEKLDWRTEMVRSFCISSIPFMDTDT